MAVGLTLEVVAVGGNTVKLVDRWNKIFSG
jgi:hypothetical protein